MKTEYGYNVLLIKSSHTNILYIKLITKQTGDQDVLAYNLQALLQTHAFILQGHIRVILITLSAPKI